WQSGTCVGSNPVTCTASDQCHDAGTCNAQTGVCSNPPKANGSSCNDGNACTQTDACQSGVCTGSNPVTCTASDQCHDAGTCNPASGVCSNPPKANGTSCNDGNVCTQNDVCQAGSCAGANTSCVAAAINNADTWMCQHPVGSNVTASSAAWQQITAAYNTLTQYNEGKLCAPARK